MNNTNMYRIRDRNWQDKAVKVLHNGIMERWEHLRSQYLEETKTYTWTGEGWRDKTGRSRYKIDRKYPYSVYQPLGNIFYDNSTFRRTYQVIEKVTAAIADRDGTCTIRGNCVHIELVDGGTASIYLSKPGPYKLHRILTIIHL